jgi:hypothetical protein
MDSRQGKMPESKAQVVAQALLKCRNYRFNLTAEWTFVISVLKQGNWGSSGTTNVVAFTVWHSEAIGHGEAAAVSFFNCSSAVRIPFAPGLTPSGDT